MIRRFRLCLVSDGVRFEFHDSRMAFYGWPISQCQTAPLSTQLKDGIRVIDVRLAVIPPPIKGAAPPGVTQNLIAYHGISPQKTPFTSILNDVYQFLSSQDGRSETIVMSIKQEDGSSTPSQFFSKMIRNAIIAGSGGWDDSKTSTQGVNRGMWFLENRIPTLGEVRGKVILFSRFGDDGAGWPQGLEGLGIHPTTWPDSKKEGFEWVLKTTRVRTQDWHVFFVFVFVFESLKEKTKWCRYAIPSTAAMSEKFALGTANLLPPRNSPEPILPITYFSGSSFPLALPPTVAKGGIGVRGMNSLLGKWLLDQVGSIVPRNVPSAVANEPADGGQVPPSSQIAHEEADDGQEAGQEPRIRGWAMLDYYDEPADARVVPLLVECNFLGRVPGEEGW
jgi:1-phosphatidylinositol phosphodiesterase